MGATQSDLRDVDNDFELVIRASKALEQKLQEMFETDHHTSHSSNIKRLQNEGVNTRVIKDLFALSEWRNKLVHTPSVNSLADLGLSRSEFRMKFEAGLKEINRVSNRRHFSYDNDNISALVSSNSRFIATSSRNEGTSSSMSSGGTMAALAIGALTLGALALGAGGSGGWVCDDCGSRHSGSDGERRYRCQYCANFDVCSNCFRSRTPPSCGHRSFKVRCDSNEPWRVAEWPSTGGFLW